MQGLELGKDMLGFHAAWAWIRKNFKLHDIIGSRDFVGLYLEPGLSMIGSPNGFNSIEPY